MYTRFPEDVIVNIFPSTVLVICCPSTIDDNQSDEPKSMFTKKIFVNIANPKST